MKALMLCGHGSRDRGAVQEFASLAEKLKARLPDWTTDYGYLEFAKPIIRDGLDRLRKEGASEIMALPGMLFAAGHAKNDIPSVLNTYAAETGITITYGRELGIDLKMLRAAGERIKECLMADGWREGEPLHDTMLVVVGRGASDPDANSNVAKVMRMLWESFGFGWGETCYSGVTFPLVEPGLTHAAKLGYRRIVVFPYFLFTGILVRRIYDATDAVAAAHPELNFLKASYIGAQDLVVETFVDRLTEILEGTNNMNCQLCKYREQMLGFEAEVGLVQESHHHHVEGIGFSDDSEYRGTAGPQTPRQKADHGHSHGDHAHHHHGHDHDDHHHHGDHGHHHAHDHGHAHGQGHSHDHGHGHHHHPYPHADHPLGPRSMR
ncbi:sirohydrochlorin chelatase [Jiella sp. MQZ9-1]|uniref:Sirohydrochlorin chelatase n=1 Tax=Jiella flava TaxID=2816857 RepID=A0A939JUJ2_9HYPH|nr:sirohydrochlorin chelatase [Jiella flava]MBO0661012.1 sirohydrochlorin chelatase [Jiella flava]MCD2469660.1 sirohydrochlorin chelatase [Jiella flava]